MTRVELVLLIVASGLLNAACSPAGGQSAAPQTTSAQSCALSALQLGPDGFAPYGLARAGPLWFSAFGRVNPGTPATLADNGGPYDGWKVVIHPDAKATGTVALLGTECSTGGTVRFCYSANGCDWDSRLQSSVSMVRVDLSAHLDYTGYMVFPGPGLMRLNASDSSGIVGTVVIEVPRIST